MQAPERSRIVHPSRSTIVRWHLNAPEQSSELSRTSTYSPEGNDQFPSRRVNGVEIGVPFPVGHEDVGPPRLNKTRGADRWMLNEKLRRERVHRDRNAVGRRVARGDEGQVEKNKRGGMVSNSVLKEGLEHAWDPHVNRSDHSILTEGPASQRSTRG